MFHLLGYDHENEGEKREMRKAEEEVLGKLGVSGVVA
jgi:ssRNA-specific RNase YbeY (16S rRNA maturation enzyme)